MGPCIGGITKDHYRDYIRAAASILSGDLEEAIGLLKDQMKKAASERKFEQAAKLRNQIYGLERMKQKRPSWKPQRRVLTGEASLAELRDALKLSSPPVRIEAFDVSHTGGTQTVASMVVFENGEPNKSHYRKFIIREVVGINDVASMNEAVYRRYAKTLKDKLPLPSLVLIDGGITQVRAAEDAMRRARVKLPIIGLAKKEETIVMPDNSSINLSKESKALQLLQRIRDEAHRFAITFHKKRRSANLVNRK